jgi:hypothetical protein
MLQSFRTSAFPPNLPLSPLIGLKPSVELLGGQLSESARAEADLAALKEPKLSGRAWKIQSEGTWKLSCRSVQEGATSQVVGLRVSLFISALADSPSLRSHTAPED